MIFVEDLLSDLQVYTHYSLTIYRRYCYSIALRLVALFQVFEFCVYVCVFNLPEFTNKRNWYIQSKDSDRWMSQCTIHALVTTCPLQYLRRFNARLLNCISSNEVTNKQVCNQFLVFMDRSFEFALRNDCYEKFFFLRNSWKSHDLRKMAILCKKKQPALKFKWISRNEWFSFRNGHFSIQDRKVVCPKQKTS